MLQYLLIILFTFTSVSGQISSTENLPSVVLSGNNLNDSITQIFNYCKCVIYYMCDEENFIIPKEQLKTTRVLPGYLLRSLRRLKCSNEFYYCCRSRTSLGDHEAPTVVNSPAPQSSRNGSKCGQSRATYFSGIVEQFPWVVAIYRKKRDTYSFKCGGSLITSRFVLTVQDCVHSSTANKIRVAANQEILSQKVETSYPLIRVKKIIKHESYNSGNLYNNVAIIILAESVNGISPVCLPKMNQDFNGQICTTVGWEKKHSSTKILRKIDLPIIESQLCERQLKNTPLGDSFSLHSSFLCTGGEEPATSKSERGGPLMCKENDVYTLVGIVSWRVDNGESKLPNLYTNIAYLNNWIQQKITSESRVQ